MNILIIEDNFAHLKITQYILERNNVDANIIVARDGQEALDYLFRRNNKISPSEYYCPDLILLDLNLPKRDGREVLKIIYDDVELRKIPVIIVSTSDREEDITYAMQNGAVGYISKSDGFDKLMLELARIGQFVKSKNENA